MNFLQNSIRRATMKRREMLRVQKMYTRYEVQDTKFKVPAAKFLKNKVGG